MLMGSGHHRHIFLDSHDPAVELLLLPLCLFVFPYCPMDAIVRKKIMVNWRANTAKIINANQNRINILLVYMMALVMFDLSSLPRYSQPKYILRWSWFLEWARVNCKCDSRKPKCVFHFDGSHNFSQLVFFSGDIARLNQLYLYGHDVFSALA